MKLQLKLQHNNAVRSFLVKVLVALVLTVTATVGSGVLAEQVGVDVGAVVYAGPCTGSGSGGGC
ncbi:MAG: hypothetical protein R2911_05230 [Caldilineaceae bacterium]